MEFDVYLSQLLENKDLSRAEVGRRLKKSPTYIYLLCSGKKPIPKPSMMSRLAQSLDCTKEEEKKLLDFSYRRVLGEHAKEVLEKSSKEIEPANYSRPVQEIPILSWVSAARFSDMGPQDYAGEWMSAKHFPTKKSQDSPAGIEGKIETDLKGKRLFALKVKNDCMEPEFRHGDIIIVDPDAGWENGNYVVARLNHDDEATFKQLKIYKNKIVLHPLNYPVFDDIEFGKQDFDKKVTIIGKVVEKKKRY